jgi:type IV fimbrial biogenesis protein FimT
MPSPKEAPMNTTRTAPRARRLQRGLSLVEISTCLAIAGIVAGAAVPSFEGVRERHHVEGAAAQFETDLQFARSAAVASGRSLRLSFDSAAACYVVHTGGAADCRCGDGAAPVCTAGAEALRTVRLPAGTPVTMSANVASMSLDSQFGTVVPTATVRFEGRRGGALHQIVNVMGRVRTCSPNGAVAGVRPC